MVPAIPELFRESPPELIPIPASELMLPREPSALEYPPLIHACSLLDPSRGWERCACRQRFQQVSEQRWMVFFPLSLGAGSTFRWRHAIVEGLRRGNPRTGTADELRITERQQQNGKEQWHGRN